MEKEARKLYERLGTIHLPSLSDRNLKIILDTMDFVRKHIPENRECDECMKKYQSKTAFPCKECLERNGINHFEEKYWEKENK